jgi:polyhydroxyalkanoate synthesis regulator phasin
MKTIFKKPSKRVITIDVGTMTREQAEEALKELMNEYKFNNGDWVRQYERKLLIENRKKKLEKLNGVTSFH